MAIKTPKALFHQNGELYVIWHDAQSVYCPVFSDEDVPPDPETLDMNVFDEKYVATAVWRPIRMTTTLQEEIVTAPYDEHTGEQL